MVDGGELGRIMGSKTELLTQTLPPLSSLFISTVIILPQSLFRQEPRRSWLSELCNCFHFLSLLSHSLSRDMSNKWQRMITGKVVNFLMRASPFFMHNVQITSLVPQHLPFSFAHFFCNCSTIYTSSEERTQVRGSFYCHTARFICTF